MPHPDSAPRSDIVMPARSWPIPRDWTNAGAYWVSPRMSQGSDRAAPFRDAGGCRQRGRASDPTEAGHHDLRCYRAWLAELLGQAPRAGGPLRILDAGCGDGRITHLMLELVPDATVLAVDFNGSDLERLLADLTPDQAARVTAACADLDELSALGAVADVVVCLEVIYMLPEPGVGYRSIAKSLRRGGRALVSNIAAESYLMHALLNRDFAQARRVLRERRYRDEVRGQAGHEFTAALLSHEERAGFRAAAGLSLVREETVSGAMALLLHALRAAGEDLEDALERLGPLGDSRLEIPRLHVEWLELSG